MSLFPTYNRFDLAVESAEGSIVKDVDGKTYIDCASGIGVCNLGHRHKAVQAAIETQLQKYWHISNLYKNPIQQNVAKLITDNSPGDFVFFCNSGAEANEAAIKLARKATGKEKIITFNQSFHGRTFATMAATGQEKVRIGFGPMLEKFSYADFNDLVSLEKEMDHETAAVLLEVVQGEGGVHPATQEFIDGLKSLCEKHGVLIIVDEIQTGIGRTGKKFGFDHYGLEPDIFTLAKGLGNGLPVGAMVAKAPLEEAFGPGTHGSTFGGNPVSMAAAEAVLETVFEPDFLHKVEASAAFLKETLTEEIAPLPKVQAIRQKGLMVGIDCGENISHLVPDLIEQGLLVLNAGENVIRLLPPLTITKEQLTEAVSLIKTALESQ